MTDIRVPTWRLISLVILIAQCALPAAAVAELALTPHTAEYKIKISVLSGKLRTEVVTDENGYKATSVLHATGLARLFVRGDVVESSTFAMHDGGVRPLLYRSTDKISKADKSMDLQFDWENTTVSGKINGADFEMTLDGRIHDRVSIQYELMLNLLNDSTGEEYALLDDDEVKLLQVSNIGTKKLKVPFGRFEAVGIQHRKKNSKRVTTLWCVEELGFLPVIIEQHREGKLTLRAVLTKYRPIPIATSSRAQND